MIGLRPPFTGVPAPTLAEVHHAVVTGRQSAREVVEGTLRTIEEREPSSRAFVEVFADAVEVARGLDASLRDGERPGPLHGVPIAVKDVFPMAGRHCRAGADFFGRDRCAVDAVAVARLRAAGAVIVGRTTTHQFGFGLDEPGTRNAVDTARAPGGSSAGSAVAVANGSVPAALGADSGGSIRVPASFNGVVGFKPTTGVVEVSDCVPMSPLLDTAGPIAATVEDCARLFDVLRGSRPARPQDPRGTGQARLGVVVPAFAEADAVVREVVGRRLADLESSGRAVLSEVRVDGLAAAPETLVTILLADSARWHRPLMAEHSAAYHPNVRALIEEGSAIAPQEYQAGLERKKALTREVWRLLRAHRLDALVCWTTPGVAPVAAPPPAMSRPELVAAHTGSAFLMLANLTGAPAVTVPCGHDGQGLPIGVCLVGRPGHDRELLAIARSLEQCPDGAAGPDPSDPIPQRTSL